MTVAEETRETTDGVRILPAALFFAMLTGIIAGGIYFMKSGGKAVAVDELKAIFNGLLSSCDARKIFLRAFAADALMCAAIFIGAFFRFGFVFPFLLLLRNGFVWGAAAAAVFYGFGLPGMLPMFPLALGCMAEMSATILFSAYSARCSLMREIKSKKNLFFLMIFAVSIFCAAALAKGFLTTRFIILVYPEFV